MSVETRSTKKAVLDYVLAVAELPDADAAEACTACGVANVEQLVRVDDELVLDLANKGIITRISANVFRDVKRWCIIRRSTNNSLPSSLPEWQEVFTDDTFNKVLLDE